MDDPEALDHLLVDALEAELAAAGLPTSGPAREAAQAVMAERLGPDRSVSLHALEAGLTCALDVARAAAKSHGKVGGHWTGQQVPLDTLGGLEHALANVQGRADDLTGQRVDGKYRLDELLAEGGFGRVYRARDLDLDCDVAIKMLKSRTASPAGSSGGAGSGDQRELEAFKQEARRLTRLAHPAIVEWKTLNQSPDGRLYLVMEFLEGEELEACLEREGRLDAARTGRILLQILGALRHAHELSDGSSLLHLDLKPSNVFLLDSGGDPAERIKVLDFGISRFAGQPATLDRTARGASGPAAQAGATTAFQVPGEQHSGLACTPLYCSPELAARILGSTMRTELDGRADLYALGVMGYRMLTGRTPFEVEDGPQQGARSSRAQGVVSLLEQHVDGTFPPLRSLAPRTPARLARFVERCLRRDPAGRWDDAGEAYAELGKFVHPRRRKQVLTVAAALLTLGFAGLWVLGPEPERPAVQALLSGQARPLGGSRLSFGPELREREIELIDLPDGASQQPAVRLVRAPRPDAEDLPGFRAEITGPRRVLLQAIEPGTSGRVAETQLGFLEVGEQGEERYSPAFELTYLPLEAWIIASVEVPGRGDRSLAARGQSLVIEAAGPADLLTDGAEVLAGGQVDLAQRDWSIAGLDRARYTLALDDWSGRSGPVAFEVRLRDKARGMRVAKLTLDLVGEPLRMDGVRLIGAARNQDAWLLLDGEPVRLELETNRPCALAWRVENAAGQELAAAVEPVRGTHHSVDLGSAGWGQGALDGRLLVTVEDSDFVLHAPGGAAGEAQRTLALHVQAEGASFQSSLTGATEWSSTVSNTIEHYLGEGGGPLVVYRQHDTPMVVRVSAEAQGQPLRSLGELRFEALTERRKSLDLSGLQEGATRLRLEGYRLGAGGEALGRRDSLKEWNVMRDTKGPVLVLDGWRGDRVLRSEQEVRQLPLRIVIDPGASGPLVGAPAPGLRCTWSLSLGTGPGIHGDFELAGTSELKVADLLEGRDLLAGDGTYQLVVQARDFAGNQGPAVTLGFVLAARGPRLRVSLPASGEAWSRVDGRFRIELAAEDPNGTASVTGTLIDAGEQLEPMEFPLERPAAEDGPWTAELELDHRWSQRDVLLLFRGVDGKGTPTLEPAAIRCTLGTIASVIPRRLAVRYLGRGGSPMRRVLGNEAAGYVFGGRGDGIENAVFLLAGLPPFGNGLRESSLRVAVPAGTLADYYLDETEVTAGQYLEFLRDPAALEVLGAKGHGRLLSVAESMASDRPMIQVTYAEAQAFAEWAGKELPTYLHWEYAVRGLGYRPFAHFVDGLENPSAGIQVNAPRPAPVGVGRDVTSDSGLRNLCSNVAEWTSTGADLRLDDAAAMLLPGIGRERYIVAGGSFARLPFHFGVVRRQRADHPAESTGFRCMVPAKRIDAAFLSAGGDLSATRLP